MKQFSAQPPRPESKARALFQRLFLLLDFLTDFNCVLKQLLYLIQLPLLVILQRGDVHGIPSREGSLGVLGVQLLLEVLHPFRYTFQTLLRRRQILHGLVLLRPQFAADFAERRERLQRFLFLVRFDDAVYRVAHGAGE